MYDRMLSEYLNSTGSAMSENETRMDSWQSKANQFSNAMAKMWDNTISTDLVKLFIDFGTATVGLIDKVGLLTVIFGGLNIALLATGKLVGVLGFVAPVLLAIVVAYTVYNKVMQNAQDNYRKLIDIEQKNADTHKALASQYENDIKKAKELITTRNNLVKSSEELIDTDQDKIDANRQVMNSEYELSQIIGQSALDKLKAAGFTEDATKIVINSLEERQNAEKTAYENSSKLVAEQTEILRENIENQIKQIALAAEAYSFLGKLQLGFLKAKQWAAYKKYQVTGNVKDARAYDEITAQINALKDQEKNNKIGKLLEQLNDLGGVKPPPIDGLNPLSGDLNPFGNPKDPNGTSTSPKISTFNLYESSLKRINDELSILKEKLESDPSLQAEINLKLNFKKDLIEREKVEIENALKEAYKELESINKDYADRIRRGDDVSDLVIINNEALANAVDNVLKLKSAYGDLEKSLWDVGKEFTSLSQQLEKIYSTQLSNISSNISKAITSIQDQIKDIESSYDSIIEKKKEELELLERQYEVEDRILKLKELDQQISDTLADRRFEFITSEGELIYTYDKKKYEDLIDERQKLLDEYKKKDLIQAKKDEIQGLEDAKRREVQIYKDRITDMQNFQSELKNLQDLELQGLKDNIDAKVEELKRYKDMWATYASDILAIQNGINNMNISSPSGSSSGGSGGSSNSSASSSRDPSKITVTNPTTGVQFYIKDGTEDNYKGYIFSGGGYAEGGETQRTGLHLLHGKPGKPERVLSSDQTISFNKLASNIVPITNVMDRMINLVKAPSFTPINNNNAPSQPSKTYEFHNVTIKANNPMEFLRGIDNLITSQG